MKKKVDLSIVITAHNEGLVAHKTMRSVMEAAERVKKAGYSFEIIIHIDNGDEATIKYFKRYRGQDNIRIVENHFGDTAPSRNYALKIARGKYVAFLDGDDLISDNWYVDAVKMLEKSEEKIIVHPEAILTFGVDWPNVLTIQGDSEEMDSLTLIGENRWGSVLVAETEVLKETPYKILEGGYGHEDYVFNIETLEKGIQHKVAPGTVLFYRRSDHSRLTTGNSHNVTIPRMEMFDFDNIRKIKLGEEAPKNYTLKERGYKVYKSIRNNDKINYFITPVAKLTLKVINAGKKNTGIKSKVPQFVIDEWLKMNHIETMLYPHKQAVRNIQIYDAKEYLGVGRAYRKIAEKIRFKPDYVFFVPWVVRGGADKVLFNYIDALKELHPDWHFTVIATLRKKNTWANRLPEYVDFVDFGEFASTLVPDMQDKLMTRLITQLGCPRLHIINSEYAYTWVKKHEELVKNHYEVYVSLFAWEYIRGSKMKAVFGYDNPRLFEIRDVVKKVLTDNRAVVEYASTQNGLDEKMFSVHYQPVRDLKLEKSHIEKYDGEKLRLLSAGRVVAVKMPELVAEIGKRLDASKVTIDVYGEVDKEISRNIFDGIPAICYKGVYDGFSSIPTKEYDGLLYTSLSDGVPNVILEAAAAGLPMIASDDGGVGEFIKDKKTGILIKDYLNAETYVEAIEFARENPEKMREYAGEAQKLLTRQHGWAEFLKNVKKDIG